jgi:ferredoxin-NADP reductase
VSLIEWHPFSISSHPAGTEFKREAGTPLSFHILDAAGKLSFTRVLADKIEKASGSDSALAALTRGMLIDGPYGHLSLDIRRFHTLILTCGGVGCTPFFSMLQYLLSAAKDTSNFPHLRKVVFIWVNRDRHPFDTWAPALLRQAQTDLSGKFSLHLFATSEKCSDVPMIRVDGGDHRAARLEQVQVEAVAPASPAGRAPPPPPFPPVLASPASLPILPGRPNFHRLFSNALAEVGADQPTLNAHDSSWSSESRAAQVAVLACGPAPMVAQVQEEAQRMRMHFHKETFAF